MQSKLHYTMPLPPLEPSGKSFASTSQPLLDESVRIKLLCVLELDVPEFDSQFMNAGVAKMEEEGCGYLSLSKAFKYHVTIKK